MLLLQYRFTDPVIFTQYDCCLYIGALDSPGFEF